MFEMSKRGGRPADLDDDEGMDREGPARPEPSPAPPRAASRTREAAVIGPSIQINGDLRGEEDLVVEGTVTGTIHLEDYSLTIGSSGKVSAEVYADNIVIDGSVEGDLYGAERIAIRKNGDVKGNIVSPRISLEDGGRVKGSIEMDREAVEAAFRGGASAKAPKAVPAAPAGARSSGSPAGGGDKSKAESAGSGGSDADKGDKKSAAG